MLLKVGKSRNVSFKLTILSKNERTNSGFFLPNSTKNEFVRSFFGRIRGYQKIEINWPLETNFIQVPRVKALFKAGQYCSWSIGFIFWKKYSVIFDIFVHTSYLFCFIIFLIYWISQDWEFKNQNY